MGDIQPEQGGDEELKPHDLRKQLDEANKERAEQAAKIKAYEQDEQLQTAGLGHLSKRQRRSILRELVEEGTGFSADAAKEVAKDLGYSFDESNQPVQQGQQTQQSQQGPANGAQQGQQSQQSQQSEEEEPLTALEALAAMDKARRKASVNHGQPDLSTEIKAAKSADELTSLLRTKGRRAGIILDSDIP